MYYYCAGESRLHPDDRPLDIALRASSLPRFVLRAKDHVPQQQQQLPQQQQQQQTTRANTPEAEVNEEWLHVSLASTRDAAEDDDDEGGDSQEQEQITIAAEEAEERASMGSSQRADPLPLQDPPAATADITDCSGGRRGRSKLKSSGTTFLAGRRSKSASKKRDLSFDGSRGTLAERDTRPGSLRSNRSRSMSNLLHKTFSLRKKGHPYCPQTELSTDDTVPGVLRIFGDSISAGTHYKSVLAVPTSTALELVKEALDR